MRTTTISRKFFDELWTVECQTYLDDHRFDVEDGTLVHYAESRYPDSNRDDEREALILAMAEPVKSRKHDVTFTLTEKVARYFADVHGGFNHEDVWREWGCYGFIRTARRILDEIEDAYPWIETRKIRVRIGR